MSEEKVQVPGALLRGGDGTIYFVPEKVLQQHVVTGEGADAAAEVFEDDEVAGFSFGHTLDANTQFKVVQAFEGPFGISPQAMGVGEEPTEVDSHSLRSFRR